MPKTITLNNIAVKEISIDEYAGGWRLAAQYEWVDDLGNRVSQKRITLYPAGSGPTPEMPAAAQTKLTDFIAALGNFIKSNDGIA